MQIDAVAPATRDPAGDCEGDIADAEVIASPLLEASGLWIKERPLSSVLDLINAPGTSDEVGSEWIAPSAKLRAVDLSVYITVERRVRSEWIEAGAKL